MKANNVRNNNLMQVKVVNKTKQIHSNAGRNTKLDPLVVDATPLFPSSVTQRSLFKYSSTMKANNVRNNNLMQAKVVNKTKQIHRNAYRNTR